MKARTHVARILFTGLLAFVAQSRGQEFSSESSAAASAKEEELAHRAIERRAVEAVIWGMPGRRRARLHLSESRRVGARRLRLLA
jgi:hypothetical protein